MVHPELLCSCCNAFPCRVDEYLALKAQERKERIDKLVMEKLMNENKFNGMDDLVVGHSEATLNTVDLRGVQVGEIKGPLVAIQSGTNPTPPKEAMRFTEGKLRFDLLPIEALIELTRVYDMGALKYDDDNWRKGMKWRQVYRPIFSHLFKWLSGQAVDSETGCHHLAMVAWNALTLLVYEIRKLGTDDRVKFAIDENFNWVDNHLGLGLPPEKIAELKEKYKQQREKAK